MKRITSLLVIIISILSFYSANIPPFTASAEKPVSEVLAALGDEPVDHQPDLTMPGVSAEKGKELALYGITAKPGGGKTGKQSKHFVCTSCHNMVKEDPDLSVSDPQARLMYAQENGIPFLQGTALYGAVNRTAFYNDDYEKKYGELVKPARNNLREAIQLCAIECSQGRKLVPWEMESVLAYLWTLELKMEDLNLTDQEYAKINGAIQQGRGEEKMIELIKSHYLKGSPATFVDPPKSRVEGYPEVKGNPDNGKRVYESSCLHCHENSRYSYYRLDDETLTFKHLNKHIAKYTRYSLYQVGRYGTSPMNGKKAYMPHYTLERMSNQQMEDLRAYIEMRAGSQQ